MFEHNVVITPFPAASDLSASQYCFVTMDTAGRIALTGDNLRATGVLQDKPDAIDRVGGVCCNEGAITKLKCGGTVTKGDLLTSDASGKATTAASTNQVNAVALSDGADGQVIPAQLSFRGAAA